MVLRCDRLFQCLPHHHELRKAVRPPHARHCRLNFPSSLLQPSEFFFFAKTTSITLTLLFRSIGAVGINLFYVFAHVSHPSPLQVIFGLISDRFGRKWPLVVNLFLISSLSLGCSFVQTYHQFLAVRSLFGVGMGGVWGLASASALENLPVEARGLASGILQQGYAGGYLIAALVNLYLIPKTSWREQFRTSAGISSFAALLRITLPESQVFLRAQEARQANTEESSQSKTRVFFQEVGKMLKSHWLLCIYAVLLMAGFNFLSHGSQDLYPTYLEASKGFTAHSATVATIVGNCGAIAYDFSLSILFDAQIILIFRPNVGEGPLPGH